MKWTALLLIFSGAIAYCSWLVRGEEIHVAGSTTVKPILDTATAEYRKLHQELRFVVDAGGSGQGVKLAGAGKIQLGMASRALKNEEKLQFPDLSAVRIGLDGIAVIVNAANPVSQITTDQVRAVYLGKIDKWKELGGADAPIERFSSNANHGTFDAFNEYLGLEQKTEGDTVRFKLHKDVSFSTASVRALDGNREVIAAVAARPRAIGYASLGIASFMASRGTPVKLLVLDGAAATEADVLASRYPLRRPLLLLTKGEPKGAIEGFLNYMTSLKGQELVKALGYIPVNEAE